jgi:hypothetical protein
MIPSGPLPGSLLQPLTTPSHSSVKRGDMSSLSFDSFPTAV